MNLNGIRSYGTLTSASELGGLGRERIEKSDANATGGALTSQGARDGRTRLEDQIQLSSGPVKGQGGAQTVPEGADGQVWSLLSAEEQRFLGGSTYGPGGLLTGFSAGVSGKLLDLRA